jgi:photosystem II stability/assembly factor-like uncharacterized protein
MVDEVELVRRFRSDVPEPSPQARAQAWAAVMAVAAEEGAEDATVAALPFAPRRRRWPRGAGRPVVALVAAVVVTAAVLTVALSVTNRPAHVPGASTTAWRPGHPVSGAVISEGAHSSPGAFRLVSYIEGPQWQKGNEQVPPGYLDCPAVNACYVLSQSVLTTVGPYPNYYNAVYFSSDGGTSWAALELPPGLEFTTPLSCPNARTCVGVAYQGDRNELVSTTDGGHRWLISPLRAPAGALYLSCATVSSCSLVTGSSYLGPGHPDQFAATTDGGSSWSVHNFASDVDISSFTCPSAADCIVIAGPEQASASLKSKAPPGLAFVTTDGGHSWSRSSLPVTTRSPSPSVEPADASQLSCASTSNCSVVADSTFFDRVQDVSKLPSHCPPDGCVLRDRVTWQPELASTSDGGRVWQVHTGAAVYLGSYTWTYSPGEPGVAARSSGTTGAEGFDLSCPGAGGCWLSTPFGQLGLVQTTDGGSRWSRQPITDKEGFLQVSCPEPGQCVALGAPTATVLDHQTLVYGHSVPVYSSVTSGR